MGRPLIILGMKKKLSKAKDKIASQKRGVIDNQGIRRLGVMIESVGDDVKLVAEQHGDIMSTLKLHTEMIGSMKEDIEIIKLDTEFIKNSLKKKVDLDEFAALERRVSLLEKRR